MGKYTEKYYESRRSLTYSSARAIIPIIQEYYKFESVADFGCADGVWLSVFNELGVDDYIGFDGPWINQDQLLIPRDRFMSIDFSDKLPKIGRRFDLCSCIEVIEHIQDKQGAQLVDYLCNLSDVILFSAAVPYQGGEGHVNERRQSYWMSKFYKNGFLPYEIFRERVWNDKSVNVIYKQNMFLYVSKNVINILSDLVPFRISQSHFLDIIHPDLYEARVTSLIKKNYKISLLSKIKSKFF